MCFVENVDLYVSEVHIGQLTLNQIPIWFSTNENYSLQTIT